MRSLRGRAAVTRAQASARQAMPGGQKISRPSTDAGRPCADVEELAVIAYTNVLLVDDGNAVKLTYAAPSTAAAPLSRAPFRATYVFHIAIPRRYPFVPPTWKWTRRPPADRHPNLGPDGLVSVEVRQQSPAVAAAACGLLRSVCNARCGLSTACTSSPLRAEVTRAGAARQSAGLACPRRRADAFELATCELAHQRSCGALPLRVGRGGAP